ncbi:MAG: hypothetical protein ABII21_04250 [bacterium]
MKKIALVLVSAFFLSGCSRLDAHQPLTTSVIPLSGGESVSQTFLSTHDNLGIVSICLRNFERAQIPLHFSLSENSSVIRSLDFSSANIDNTDCTRLSFEAVADSGGHTYVASVSAGPPVKGSLNPAKLSVETSGAGLHFKTFYRQELGSVIRESFAQFIARLTLDIAFLLPYLATLLVLLFLIIKKK